MQYQQVVRPAEGDPALFQSGFQVFFYALLGMKNGGVVAWMAASTVAHLCDVPIFLGFANPLKCDRLHR